MAINLIKKFFLKKTLFYLRKKKELIRYLITLSYLKRIQIISRIWNYIPKIRFISKKNLSISKEIKEWEVNCWRIDPIKNDKQFNFLNEIKTVELASDWNNKDFKKLWLYNLECRTRKVR